MTPNQLRSFLARAGLTQRAAAEALGISERHVRRYAAGGTEIPRVVELALTALKGVKP